MSNSHLRRGSRAFTLVEIMISITILALILAAIFSSWTAILRSTKVGLDAAASVQRIRIAIRVIEDSLSSATSFVVNQGYYGFEAQNGDDPELSFVARLSKTFPRSGRFGDYDVRRVTFSVESGRDGSQNLVLRQTPVLFNLDDDPDERDHPLLLAKNVKEFSFQFWDDRTRDWIDEWKQTNQLPKLIMVNLKLADHKDSRKPTEEITRIINIPSMSVAPTWQVPRLFPGAQGPGGLPQGPGGLPPGQGFVPPGQSPITTPGKQ